MGQRFLRVKRVAERYDTSPSSIWRWANEKRFEYLGFPRPIKIGPHTTAWAESDLDAWDVKRAAADAVA